MSYTTPKPKVTLVIHVPEADTTKIKSFLREIILSSECMEQQLPEYVKELFFDIYSQLKN